MEELFGSKSLYYKTSILDIWFSSDGQYGELRNVKKGFLNGNDVLAVHDYFDHLFQIKKTFICDVSDIGEEGHEVPLRLISAIATGETWYEKKLGAKLFECRNFQTVANGVITQNSLLRNVALKELQQLTVKKW